MNVPKSKCCNEPLVVVTGEDATSFYLCSKCRNASDLAGDADRKQNAITSPKEDGSNWRNEFREKFPDISHVGCNHDLPCGTMRIDIENFISSTLLSERKKLADAAEMLWVVLANVNGGDWSKQSEEWKEAAKKWRDNYFKVLSSL